MMTKEERREYVKRVKIYKKHYRRGIFTSSENTYNRMRLLHENDYLYRRYQYIVVHIERRLYGMWQDGFPK